MCQDKTCIQCKCHAKEYDYITGPILRPFDEADAIPVSQLNQSSTGNSFWDAWMNYANSGEKKKRNGTFIHAKTE